MRRLSFLIAIIGIFSLCFYTFFSVPLEISDQKQIKYLLDNQKVLIKGKVVRENVYEDRIILTLNNNLSLSCEFCIPPYKNNNITAIAIYDNFYKNFEIKELK